MPAKLIGTEFTNMHALAPWLRVPAALGELGEAMVPVHTGELAHDWLRQPGVWAVGSVGAWKFARRHDHWDARGDDCVDAERADEAVRVVTGLVPAARSATGVTRFVLRTDAALCWLAKHLTEQNHRRLP